MFPGGDESFTVGTPRGVKLKMGIAEDGRDSTLTIHRPSSFTSRNLSFKSRTTLGGLEADERKRQRDRRRRYNISRGSR